VIDHKLDFSGLLDISHDMELLSKAENKKVLRDGTRAGAEVLKEEVIKRAGAYRETETQRCRGHEAGQQKCDLVWCSYPWR
jgi:hypothetical protein